MTTPQIEPQPPKLSYIKLPKNARFWAVGRPQTKPELATLFFAHTHYAPRGERWLAREESRDVMRGKYYGAEYRTQDDVMDRFDDRQDPMTIAFLETSNEDIGIFLQIIGIWLNNMYKTNSAFKERADLLNGFPGGRPSMKPLTNKQRLRVGKNELEPHQYLVHFGVANWGKDRANNDLTLDYKTDVLVDYYQIDMRPTISHHTEILARPNLEITRYIASVAPKTWLLPKIESLLSKYEENKLGLPPRSTSNVNPIPEVTLAMEDASIRAPVLASSSGRPKYAHNVFNSPSPVSNPIPGVTEALGGVTITAPVVASSSSRPEYAHNDEDDDDKDDDKEEEDDDEEEEEEDVTAKGKGKGKRPLPKSPGSAEQPDRSRRH